jgi:hypothetical protein
MQQANPEQQNTEETINQLESQEADTTHVESAPKEPSKDENFARLREAKTRAERERDELHARLVELEKTMQKKEEPADDDYVEWRQVKGHLNKIQQQLEQQTIEQRLKQQYPDIDQVITADAIATLNEREPELARAIRANSNQYEQAVAAYKALKRFGIYQDPASRKQQERVEQNMSKPRSLNSLAPQEGESPLHKANAFADGLTDDLKAQLWKEMRQCIDDKI